MSFLKYPNYRNIFGCIPCRMHGDGSNEFQCSGCGCHACEHLVVLTGGSILCFCCYRGTEIEWPDWSFTMEPEREP